MMRLIQGDVGSGKTVVAAIACLKAIACGVQAAIMAPTELLAEQHWRSFSDWFRPLGVEPAWLSGSQKARRARESLAAIADGEAQLVVGTHALFQEGVEFDDLGADRHRRAAPLRRASAHGAARQGRRRRRPSAPARHDGDADPAHAGDGGLRRPRHVDHRRAAARPPARSRRSRCRTSGAPRSSNACASACAGGQQAYWVCPLIEESEVARLRRRPRRRTRCSPRRCRTSASASCTAA